MTRRGLLLITCKIGIRSKRVRRKGRGVCMYVVLLMSNRYGCSQCRLQSGFCYYCSRREHQINIHIIIASRRVGRFCGRFLGGLIDFGCRKMSIVGFRFVIFSHSLRLFVYIEARPPVIDAPHAHIRQAFMRNPIDACISIAKNPLPYRIALIESRT